MPKSEEGTGIFKLELQFLNMINQKYPVFLVLLFFLVISSAFDTNVLPESVASYKGSNNLQNLRVVHERILQNIIQDQSNVLNSQQGQIQIKATPTVGQSPQVSQNANGKPVAPSDSPLMPVNKQQPKVLISQIDKPILGKGFKVDNGISYQRLNVQSLQKKFLFLDFKLAEKDKWQNVNITITVDGTEMIIKECQYDGFDSCYISNNQLKEKETLFITIKCQDQCKYNLNCHWSDIEHLNPGDQYIFKFGNDTFQLYHVQLEQQNFEELRVHVAPRVTQKTFNGVKIYGKYGKDSTPSPSDYDFKSISLWQDGEGVFLSRKSMKERRMTLLLVGQEKTTYRLTCELITASNHKIQNGEHVYEYLDAGESKSYHISEFDTKKYEQFSLRVSVLSGYVQIQYFYDKELQSQLPFEPFRYMDDSEYILDSNQISQFATSGIYVRISSRGQGGHQARDTTYTIKFNGRKKAEAVELNEHVYGFIALNEERFAYFNFKRWVLETEERSNLKFTVAMLQVLGNVVPEFRICNATLLSCTDPGSYKEVTTLLTGEHQDLSQKQYYHLQIDESYLRKINLVQVEGIVVVRLTAELTKNNSLGFSLAALEFVNNNKVLYLRQGRPLEQRLSANEMKLYKYINSDPNVREIRVHVNNIAGLVKVSGVSQEDSSTRAFMVQPQGNTLRFVSNLAWPILVQVKADSKAIFGISMQVILKGETEDADVRVIGQDLAYTVRIKPQSYSIFEVAPIYYRFTFSYQSSQSVMVCPLNMVTGACLDNKESKNLPRLSFKGQITNAQLSKDRKSRIKITNPFSDSIAEVTIIFHSREFNHCDRKIVGRVYSETVRNGTCYSYLLQEEENTGMELYISKREFATMKYSVFVCGNNIANVEKLQTLTLPSDLIKLHCKGSIEAKQITVLWLVNTDNVGKTDLEVRVDFVSRRLGGIVMLPEGVSYMSVDKSKEGVLKTFGFSLINKLDTRVYIRPIIGSFQAFAKIIKDEDREIENISEISYHFASSNSMDYSQQPEILIPKKNIENAHCIGCALLIGVYSLDQPGRTVQFQIEVVQRYESLSDDSSVKGYLEAGSFAYYTYVSKAEQATLIFFLSDHNQRCSNMYIGLMEDPGPKNHLAKVFESNELIYNHRGEVIKYFLAVEAIRTCDYALSVLQIDSSIHRLERGKQNMVKLLKGEVRYFTFQQYSEQPFKIISLSKFGEVRFHLNISSDSPNKKTWTVTELNAKKFEAASEQANTLTVNKDNKVYCTKCDYFLAAQALTTTFSTVFLVYPQTIVPLLRNRFFSDYFIKKGDFTLASYNNVEKTKLQLTVHSGSIEITAIYKAFKSTQSFQAKSAIQSMIIDVSENSVNTPIDNNKKGQSASIDKVQLRQRIPINFVLKALQDGTSYTLQIKSLVQSGNLGGFASYQNILAGEPNHVEISNNKILCIDGHLRDSNEEILITTNSDNQEKLSQLIFNLKVRNETATVEKTILKNVIALKLIDPNPKNKDPYNVDSYEVCMKLDTTQVQKEEEEALTEENKQKEVQSQTNETQFEDEEVTMKVVVTQINSVNILPSDTSSVIKGNNTYVIHSDGEFIMDVLECKGDAKVSYSDSLVGLQSTKAKLLDAFGMSKQRHAVKISQSDVTFMRVSSEHAVVRWMPLNLQTDEGSGYLKFQAGELQYSSKFKHMSIEFQPLQNVKATKSSILQIEYFLYISNGVKKLEYATQCSPEVLQEVVMINLGKLPYSLDRQKEYHSYNVEKDFLEKKFGSSENIYVNIVAVMMLELAPNISKNPKYYTSIMDDHEHYRFIYSRQQMLLQSYKPNQIQSIPYHFLALIVGSIVVVLLLITYLFTRKIAPMIARLRNRHLVEEQEQPPVNKDDLEVVPPSSDRNQRAVETAIQTEDKMKS